MHRHADHIPEVLGLMGTKKWTRDDHNAYSRAYMKRLREENPDKVKDAKLRDKYGIGLEEFRQRIEDQDGLCAICGVTMEKPHVDHDHVTGKVRGVLCAQCNVGLGMFRDDPSALHAAIEYLLRYYLGG